MSVYEDAGAQWDIDPNLLRAMELHESGGKTSATSSAGAEGNAQFMRPTARAVGVANTRDRDMAIFGMAKHLHDLREGPAKGDVTTAVRMYHGGPDTSKWGAANAAYAPAVFANLRKIQGQSVSSGGAPSTFNPARMSEADLLAHLDKEATGAPPEKIITPSAPDFATMTPEQIQTQLDKEAAGAAAPSPTTKAQPSWPVRAVENVAGGIGSLTRGLSFGMDRYLSPPTALAVDSEANRKRFSEENPLISGSLEALGALPTYVGGVGALERVIPSVAGSGILAKGVNLASSSARNALVSGAASAGMADENPLAAALQGAAIGAAVPPVLSAAGGIIGAAARPTMARVSGLAAENQATNSLYRAMGRDSLTAGDLGTNLRTLGPDAALIDAGGTNVRRLGETVANSPGAGASQAATFLEDRAAGQGSRINEAITRATGSRGDFHAALGDLAQQRSTAAAPLYEAAFAQPVTLAQVRPVHNFITDPIGQDALQRGMRVAELESLANRKLFNPDAYGVVRSTDTGKWIIDPSVASGEKAPSLRMLDAVKRGYDDIVEGFRDPVTHQLNLDQYGRAVNSVRGAYNGALRKTFPGYAEALDAWAGPSRAMDALSMGRRAIQGDQEISAKTVAALSPSDKEFFLNGVARSLKDKVESVQDGADATRRIFGNKLVRDRIKAALGDDVAFNQFRETMEREAAFARTRNEILKGSPTARRLAGQAEEGVDMLTPGLLLAHGRAGAAAMNLAHQGAASLMGSPAPAYSEALGRHLFTPGGSPELLAALSRNRNPLASPMLTRLGTLETNRLYGAPQ